MDAKEFLKNIRCLDSQIRNKQIEIYQLQGDMQSIKGISYEPKFSTSSNGKSPQEIYINKLVGYQLELNAIIDEMVEQKKKAMKLIDKLSKPEYIDILYRRYIHGQKWEQIALDMEYSFRNVLKLHGLALQELNKIIKECT